jgi:serine/threonine-protein kinase RIO1
VRHRADLLRADYRDLQRHQETGIHGPEPFVVRFNRAVLNNITATRGEASDGKST